MVFETLTQQYELAKVQEAKEIPTVKVLDAPDVPEKKSFPPRGLITLGFGLFAFVGGFVFLLGSRSWRETDPSDINKALAREIWVDLKEKRILNSVNGSEAAAQNEHDGLSDDAPHGKKHSILSFLGLRNGSGGNGSGESKEKTGESSETKS